MELLISITLILSAMLIGAASPGPSFLLIAKIALGSSRKEGVAASMGMGMGAVVFSMLALFGLHVVLTKIPTVYLALKALGGMYLIYMAIHIWKKAKDPINVTASDLTEKVSPARSFLIGLITQLSNPKTAIVYGSIFAALLPQNIPTALYYLLPPLIFIVEAGWYLTVTFVLSTASPRAIYIRSKLLFDRVASGILAGLGIKKISSTVD